MTSDNSSCFTARLPVHSLNFLIAILFSAMAVPSEAAVIQYTDAATFLANVGHPDVTEDFEGFLVDTPFDIASGPLALAGNMSIVEVGTSTIRSDRNRVDVSPFDFPDNSPNGSTYANLNLADPEHDVEITLNSFARAWGADFANARGGAFLEVFIFDPSTNQLSSLVAPADDSFIGFETTAGESIAMVALRPDGGFTSEEDLGMDNILLVFVPEPGACQIALLGFLLLGRARRLLGNRAHQAGAAGVEA